MSKLLVMLELEDSEDVYDIQNALNEFGDWLPATTEITQAHMVYTEGAIAHVMQALKDRRNDVSAFYIDNMVESQG